MWKYLHYFSVLGVSWLSMMLIHEFGHVVSGWLTGAEVERVSVKPLRLSQTLFSENPHPLIVAFGGPILGALAPLPLLLVSKKAAIAYALRFFAGFCLIANGLYMGSGMISPVGDAQEVLSCGGSRYLFLPFLVIAVPLGLYVWHGTARDFGFDRKGIEISRRKAAIACAFLVIEMGILFAVYGL
jgi:hypothetical protein